MDALRGMIPGGRIDLNNNQPDPVGHAWLRNVREMQNAVVDLYMPRGEDGRRQLDLSLSGLAICGTAALFMGIYNVSRSLSSVNNDITDVGSSTAAEVQHSLLGGVICSCTLALGDSAAVTETQQCVLGGIICSCALVLGIKAFEYMRNRNRP